MILDDTNDVIGDVSSEADEATGSEDTSLLAKAVVPIIYLIVMLVLGMALAALALPQGVAA